MIVQYLKRIISGYNIFLIIFGSIGNMITIYICSKKNMRSTSTFKLYAFNSVFDILSLYPWNISQFLEYYFDLDIENMNLFWCEFNHFIQFTAFELSAWFLVN